MREFGLQPAKINNLKRNRHDILGYVETHIEQGPVLENMGSPVGIVTAICGIERWVVTLHGRVGHAGTTPMELRQDALTGAAEIVLEVERLCRDTEQAVGVVGQLNVNPNAPNAIPGKTQLQIELRSSDDEVRTALGNDIKNYIQQVAAQRQLQTDIKRTYAQNAAQCDPKLSSTLEGAAKKIGQDIPHLMSGATHDASAMADLTPIGMLFVRCLRGISHNKEESITGGDAEIAAQILETFLLELEI